MNNVPEIRFEGFVETCVPEYQEQTTIGNFFRTLDTTITLQKRKLDGLRKLKAGYLRQMFPQSEERVPRVRFAGFSGDWETRKLGETANDISRASVVVKAGVILGGDLNIVKPDSTIYPIFLAIAMSNGEQQKELSKRAQGKSAVHISNSGLKDVTLQLPTIVEQTAIGNFFRTFDEQIAAQAQRVEQHRKLKAAYLQKMFV